MKAIVQDRYGPPDVLEFQDVDDPVPAAGEVLVRVHAASVNAADWHIMRGDPYLARLMMSPAFTTSRPKARISGRDYAGVVEAVGPEVTRFRPGDEVYGDRGDAGGAFAEYVCAPTDEVAPKPVNLTFEQAAAMPLAASTALVGLRDVGKTQPGQRVLINGASGGVGTFAVQIAKSLGAEVTAVCGTRNVDMVRSLRADHVVDYKREDFTQGGRRYDVVLDLVGNRSLAELRGVLTPDGTLALSGGGTFEGGSLVGPMGLFIKAKLMSRFVKHRLVDVSVPPDGDRLAALTELAEAGKLTPVIDRTYPLSETAAAVRYVETEHARAKVVIDV